MAEYRPKAPEEITRNMRAIRSKDNKTESALRREIHRMGLRYRKYRRGLPGRPDLVFGNGRVAVFVDGDYWHARILVEKGAEAFEASVRNANRAYWLAKLRRNAERDAAVSAELRAAGWLVVRLWESDVKKDIPAAAQYIADLVRRRRSEAEPAPRN